MKRIITFLLILAVCFSTAQGEQTITIQSDKGMSLSILDMDVYTWDIDASDPWNTYANPGDPISIGYSVCNWESETKQYLGDLILVDELGNGVYIFSTDVLTLDPGECYPDFEFEYTAPATPGDYTIKAITSFYPSGLPDDIDYFYLHISGDTTPPPSQPTVTPTEGPTAPPAAQNIPPVVSVVESKEGYIHSYDARSSTDTDGSIVSYAWTVDTVAAGSTDLFSVDVSKFSQGDYIIQLIITDNNGAVSSYTQTLTVEVDESDSLVISAEEPVTIQGSVLDTDRGTASFVVNIAGEPYYLPGFDSCIAFMGLMAVFLMAHREKRKSE